MEIFNIKVILLMIKKMELDILFMKMVNIISVNGVIIYQMEKEQYIIQMEILNIKVILLMIKKMELGILFMKIVNIISVNGVII